MSDNVIIHGICLQCGHEFDKSELDFDDDEWCECGGKIDYVEYNE